MTTLAAALVATCSIWHASLIQAQTPPPPPPGLPTQTNSQTVVIGSYQLVVPTDITVTSLKNGRVQLRKGPITAHVATLPQPGPAVATDQLPAVIRAWNLDRPLSPLGRIVAGKRPEGGGTLATQRYQQNTNNAELIHGLFLVYIGSGPTPEAFVVDVFASGPARDAQDWELLNQFATTVMGRMSLRRPW